MKFPALAAAARRGRSVIHRAFPALAPAIKPLLPGGFQPYNFTLPDRYPWLFEFAANGLQGRQPLCILSFGCSRGAEPFSLRRYFPEARIEGIDVDPDNIAECEARVRAESVTNMTFTTASDTKARPSESFDAIFCLAVLCQGDLTTTGAQRCDPYLLFERFEAVVADFARCLKPGGLLLLHTANFRFGDTAVSRGFDVVLTAEPEQMAPDVVFDRNNRLLAGESYRAVGFRKQ